MSIYLLKTPPDQDDVTLWHILVPQRGSTPWKPVTKCATPLSGSWRPPRVEIVYGPNVPDFFPCLTDWAVTEEVVEQIAEDVGDDVEFLPIECDFGRQLFLLHALRVVPLGPQAVVTQNPLSRNITSITQYDFLAEDISDCTFFQVQQDRTSLAYKGGYACSGVCVAQKFAEVLIECGFKGVELKKVFPE